MQDHPEEKAKDVIVDRESEVDVKVSHQHLTFVCLFSSSKSVLYYKATCSEGVLKICSIMSDLLF